MVLDYFDSIARGASGGTWADDVGGRARRLIDEAAAESRPAVAALLQAIVAWTSI